MPLLSEASNVVQDVLCHTHAGRAPTDEFSDGLLTSNKTRACRHIDTRARTRTKLELVHLLPQIRRSQNRDDDHIQ